MKESDDTSHYPQQGALISLDQAQRERRCRICGEVVCDNKGKPIGWTSEFRSMVYPVKVTLNFGAEFAHTDCLEATQS